MDELDDKLNDILKDTGEYEKIRSELGDSYLLSGEDADDELESILGEFGGKQIKDVPSPIREGLSTEELIAVSEGVQVSPYAETEELPHVETNVDEKTSCQTADDGDSANAAPETSSDRSDSAATVVFGGGTSAPLEFGEKNLVAEIDEKIVREKEEKFFGRGSKIKENVFNWEKDRDLRVPSRDEAHLPDGQVSFLSKEQSEQDRKLTGYFTDVYSTDDVAENLNKLRESREKSVRTAEVGIPKFHGLVGKLFNEPESDEEPVIDSSAETVGLSDESDDSETAAGIVEDLSFQKRQALFRIIFAAVVSVALLIIDIVLAAGIRLPEFMDYTASAIPFGIAELGLLLVVVACGFRSFFGGYSSLFTLKPSNDTAPAVAITVAAAEIIAVMICGAPSHLITVTGVAALGFTVNLVAKYLRLCAVSESFDVVSAEGSKHVAVPVALFPGCGAYDSEIAIMKTDSVRGFMDSVTAYDGTEHGNIYLIPALLVTVVVSALLAVFRGYSAVNVLTFAANAAVLTACFVSPLAAALPIFRESRTLAGRKAAVLSSRTADALDGKECITVSDNELFDAENMRVNGMKVFDEKEIYDTIVAAASLYGAVGGPASKAFAKLLGKDDSLLPVNDLTIREGIGLYAEIGGRRIYSGIPSFINSLGVSMPGVDFAAAYTKSGGRLIAVADDKKLLGIFSLTYTGGRRMKNAMRLIRDAGYTLVVCTDDANITPRMISSRYKIDNVEIRLAGSVHDDALFRAVSDKSFIPAKIVSADGPLGCVHAMLTALRMKRSCKIGDIVRIAAVGAGAFVALFLSATGNLGLFGAAAVLVFQAIWLAVLAVITIFRL